MRERLATHSFTTYLEAADGKKEAKSTGLYDKVKVIRKGTKRDTSTWDVACYGPKKEEKNGTDH